MTSHLVFEGFAMNRLIAAQLAVLCAILWCSVARADDNAAEPAAVAGKGYRLVWNDEFDGLGTVDLKNTGAPGYRWYVNTGVFSAEVESCVTAPEPSVIRIDKGGFPNWQLSSSFSPEVGLNLDGAQGFYIEGRIRFPAKNQGPGPEGFPAFWLNPTENTYGVAQWPGQEPGYINRVECDIMEYAPGDMGTYFATIHQWIGVSRWGLDPHLSNMGQNVVRYPDGVPNNRWHTYGVLTIPSTKSPDGRGSIQYYLDNVATPIRIEWIGPDIGTPPPKPPHVYANFEHQHHVILLGTGKDWPMDVDWVRVWQVPE